MMPPVWVFRFWFQLFAMYGLLAALCLARPASQSRFFPEVSV
jgi:hypothetical protein